MKNGMDDQGTLGRLHYELIHGLMEDAACPTESELAYRMSVSPVKVEELLHALSAIHGVVLHPCECRPWVIHPFSLTPTINWIEGQRAGWWAPCVWCALGVAALVGGEVRCGSGALRRSWSRQYRSDDKSIQADPRGTISRQVSAHRCVPFCPARPAPDLWKSTS